MNDDDLIRRGDAIAACAVGPSDEWARATKSGYMQAATDCTFNVLRIPAAVSRAQRAALAAIQPADPVTNAGCCQPVKVKPLDWVLATTVYDPGEAYEAICPVGVYVVAQDEDSPSLFNVEYGAEHKTFLKGQPLLVNVTRTIEAAKAAAQADYEARILAALEPINDHAMPKETTK